jgi:hypothetical protein
MTAKNALSSTPQKTAVASTMLAKLLLMAMSLAVVLSLAGAGAAKANLPEIRLIAEDGGLFSDNYFGIHVHRPEELNSIPLVKNGSWRLWDLGVSWAALEPLAGNWNFGRLDALVAKGQKQNVEMLLVLGQTPGWAASRPNEPAAYGLGQASPPKNIEHWRRYVRTVAQRYRGQIKAYELWNEVDQKSFWTGTVPQLVDLAKVAREELNAVDPEAKLFSPSMVGLDWRLGLVSDFLSKGGRLHVQGLSYHLYHATHPSETMIIPLVKFRNDIKALGLDQLPKWNTETGYYIENNPPYYGERWAGAEADKRVSPELAAQYAPKDMLLSRVLGFERYYWYAWDNKKMGMIEPVTKRKRVYGIVIENFADMMLGSRVQSCERDAVGVWMCKIRNKVGKLGGVYWLDPKGNPQSTIQVSPGYGVRYFDGRVPVIDASGALRVLPEAVFIYQR